MNSVAVLRYSITPNMYRTIALVTILAALAAGNPKPATAQSPAGDFGVGGQLGEPSGVSIKFYQRPGFAYEVLAAWDLDDFFFLNGHALYEKAVPDSPLRYYLGPGVLIGIRENAPDDDFVIGISGEFGVNFFLERYEVFLHLTPRLGVIPDTDGDVGGGIGLRYYF